MLGRVLPLVFAFFLVGACLASCHHDCNGNGDCVEDECQCYDYWVGSDCSIPFLPLVKNTTVQGRVSGDWIYYYTQVEEGTSAMTFTLTDGLLGDCDLYIRYNAFPSKHHSDYHNNGWGSTSVITIDDPQEGVWVTGVYNFLDCSFSLRLTVETVNNCPAGCSGHGTCNLDNVCLCDPLWAGDDCSVPIENLADQEYSKTAVAWEWDWYYYDTTAQGGLIPDFQVVVNQTMGGGCDTDLYIKFDDLPQLWEYDYRNALTIQDYALTVGGPMEGRYYIGVYTYSVGDGYEECGYTIRVNQAQANQECESRCSSHGYCNNGICECNGPFSGSNCETMTEDLHEGQTVAGFANNNQWNYYTATANSATNMIISVDQDWNEGGDCDLYIRAGEAPTRFNYDYRNIGFDNSFSIVVENPLATHWHIGVFGYHHCQYFIMETLDASACPNACSGNGQCVSGRCSCNDGFAGQNCASPLTRIRSKDYLSDSIGQSRWHYYKFTAPTVHTSISVALIEQETSGSLELYVLEGAPPELTGAQYSDTTLSDVHSVYFQYDGTEDNDHDFYIGVYGTSLVPLGSPVPYSIFVYSPPI